LSYISPSFPAINKLGRLPATSVINSPWSVAAECIALGARTVHSTRWSKILAQNHDFCLPHLHLMPPSGGPRRNIAMTFGMEKLKWRGYPMVKKFKDTFICLDRIHERDRQMDRQTPHNGIGRARVASCSKNIPVEQSGDFYLANLEEPRATN